MLKSLQLTNFTVFSEADLRFCPGLNVVLGQNGTGKTMLLKAAYLMNRAWPDLMFKRVPLNQKRADAYFETRLLGLFQPTYLADLIRAGTTGDTRLHAELDAFIPMLKIFTDADQRDLAQFPLNSLTEPLCWEIALRHDSELTVASNAKLSTNHFPEAAAVNAYVPKSLFIPSKEIASFYDGLIALLDRYEIKLDDTYRDLARSMSSPELLNVPALAYGALADLETELGGKLILNSGKLTFVTKDRETDAPLMAEGFRKLATLLYLIRRGALSQSGETLFWDEPEANLNPRYIRWIATALHSLAHAGVQVIVATHSLLFARELEILVAQTGLERKVETRYFGLHGNPNVGVEVMQGDSMDDIGDIAALEESLKQSDRYLAMEG